MRQDVCIALDQEVEFWRESSQILSRIGEATFPFDKSTNGRSDVIPGNYPSVCQRLVWTQAGDDSIHCEISRYCSVL